MDRLVTSKTSHRQQLGDNTLWSVAMSGCKISACGEVHVGQLFSVLFLICTRKLAETSNLWDKTLAFKFSPHKSFSMGFNTEFAQANFTEGSGFGVSSQIWLNLQNAYMRERPEFTTGNRKCNHIFYTNANFVSLTEIIDRNYFTVTLRYTILKSSFPLLVTLLNFNSSRQTFSMPCVCLRTHF